MKLKLMVVAAAAMAAVYAQDVKTAEQVYKNITALKGMPADQLNGAMTVISASLGVECSTCHVQGKPEDDSKGPKKTARAMIEMTAMINKNAFNGRQQVTCYSCHNGHERPTAIPPVLESDPPMRSEAPAAAPGGARPPQVTADEVIAKYVAAVGGEAAIKKITTRVGKGEITAMGSKQSIELITKSPNKRITITHGSNGDSMTAFDGNSGWMGNSGRPGREMDPGGSSAAALDAEFALALRVKELYPQIRRGRPETVNGVECEVLQANPNGNHPAIRLSFAKDTGLLMRMVRYADTPVGRNPTQVDYADYRDADGVKIPFRWTLSRTNGRFTIQLNEVKSNVPVEDSKFAKP